MVKKAVLIGINYKNTSSALKGCIKDVNSMSSFLISNCAYTPANVKVLTEESAISPTRKNIEANIAWLVSNCAPGDTLVFYYSGHGSQLNEQGPVFTESDRKNEIMIPLDYQASGVITDNWLFNNLADKVPSGTTLWAFTDCCHSGTMLDIKYNYQSLCTLKDPKVQISKSTVYNPSQWSDQFTMALEQAKTLKGNVYLFSGCMDSQTSADASFSGGFAGAFSHCLLQFLQNNIVRQQNGVPMLKKVKVRDLFKEINCRLFINGFSQKSQFSCNNVVDFEKTFDI
jgi:hypothetical protein